MGIGHEPVGEEGPTELDAVVARVDALRRAGNVKDAIELLAPVVDEYSAIAGTCTPRAISLRNALTSLWVEEASDPERIVEARRLVADCERVLSADDATTISARDHLASLLAVRSEHHEALTISRRTVTDAARLFGDDAPPTRHVRANLAATLLSVGRPGEAVRELDAVLAGSSTAPERETVCRALRARHLLALCHRELGRTEDTRALLEHLVPDAAKLLGPDAPFARGVARLLDQVSSYRGPLVTARGDFPRRWVFVADARTSLADRFAVPAARARRLVLAGVADLPVEPSGPAECTEDVADEVDVDVTGVDVSCAEDTVRVEARIPPEASARGRDDAPGVEVRVLGPLEIVGWRDPGGRATQLAEILSYLVFHRARPVRGPALRVALRPDIDDEITEETLHAYVSLLRRAVGRDLFPSATRDGYRISNSVTSDWERFCVLAGPEASPENLEQALRLVRGRPFAGVPEGTFRWVDTELVVSQIDAAVAEAATRLATASKSAGDTERASWAVRQGLSCSPYDISLWRLHVSLAEGRGRGALARARKEAEAALGTDATPLAEQPVAAIGRVEDSRGEEL